MHHISYPDKHHDAYSRTLFGFWLYLMTDCVLFGAIFAAYAVLVHSTAGGPSAREIIHLPSVLLETLILLTSSFTIALGMFFSHNRKKFILYFAATFLLGAVFLAMQWLEISRLVAEGATWQRSAFLSAYFTLLGTHGIHIFFGLLFMIVFVAQAIHRGFTPVVLTRLTCLRLFWLFLYLIWIIMYSYVYLLGVR